MIDPDLKISDLAREKKGLLDLQQPNSILTWHVTLEFDRIYTFFYCIMQISVHIYKGKDKLKSVYFEYRVRWTDLPTKNLVDGICWSHNVIPYATCEDIYRVLVEQVGRFQGCSNFLPSNNFHSIRCRSICLFTNICARYRDPHFNNSFRILLYRDDSERHCYKEIQT